MLIASEFPGCPDFPDLSNNGGPGIDKRGHRFSLHFGDQSVEKIEDGLTSSDFLVIILSNASTQSRWVQQELDAATVRSVETRGIRILPVVIEQCEIPPFLAHRKYADFSLDPAAAHRELLAAIEHHFSDIDSENKSFRDTRLAVIHMSEAPSSLALSEPPIHSGLYRAVRASFASVAQAFFGSPSEILPKRSFTIANRSGSAQIIVGLDLDVLEYHPCIGVAKTRVLKPITTWDIKLPYGTGAHTYEPAEPILIEDQDAVTIALRFFCEREGKAISPREEACYLLSMRFRTDQGLLAPSKIFSP
jgi:hypothetical protein